MRIPKNLSILLLAMGSALSCGAAGPLPVELKAGMTISGSVKIKPGIYRLNGTDSLNRQVILIRGNNITVDFNNAVLQGSNDKKMPNEFYGLAILITGDNITLKNAHIKGYKVAVMAKGCKNLHIEYCDLSYNYRQHLQSNWQREDLSDWMSYHHNEHNEWLRYGAGIYLEDCSKPSVNNNTITGGQCGLMMVRTNDGSVYANDFSFNSAIGIGMYRSSRNNILNNKLDFNVRGYSHGFYYRGQDSAGFLVFEQCNDNVFAYNSATHGGDGFFLWAGQTTMDSGEGGCNDNLIYANDFSYAPTNGVEITFSRNTVKYNTIKECDHGIWGGYSFNTDIISNVFTNNRIGIAIEHGQNNRIIFNNFEKNKEGIRLWARRTQPPDWGYANKRDTRSMNYLIDHNNFRNEALCCNISLTENVSGKKNGTTLVSKFLKTDTSVRNISLDSGYESGFVFPESTRREKELQNSKLPGLKKIWITDSNLLRKNAIRITEWGPYDYRYPILFLKKIDSNDVYHFDVLGPKGTWTVKTSKGISGTSSVSGVFPAEITTKKTGPDVNIGLEYSGTAFTDAFGNTMPAGKKHPFSFRDFQPLIDWNVNWYSWNKDQDPNKSYTQFSNVFNNVPVKTEQTNKIDYTWWGEIGRKLPADSFATVAIGRVELEKGLYTVGVTADDLVKVFIDGKPVIDFWDATKYKYDEDTYHAATVELGGTHTIRIEHVENSGYATLIFYLKPL